MEKDSGKIFRELKDDVSTYVELKLELLKLSTYERSGQLIATLSYGLILLFLAFLAILFIFLALGLFLGDAFNSMGSRLCCSGRVIFSSHWARSFKQKYNLPDDHKHCTGSIKR